MLASFKWGLSSWDVLIASFGPHTWEVHFQHITVCWDSLDSQSDIDYVSEYQHAIDHTHDISSLLALNGDNPYVTTVLHRYIQCRHLIPALNAGKTERNTRPHAQLPPSFLDTYARVTSQLNASYVDHWSTLLIFDMLSMGVCTTRHCQTSSQLLQESNVYTVSMQYGKHSVHSPSSTSCVPLFVLKWALDA